MSRLKQCMAWSPSVAFASIQGVFRLRKNLHLNNLSRHEKARKLKCPCYYCPTSWFPLRNLRTWLWWWPITRYKPSYRDISAILLFQKRRIIAYLQFGVVDDLQLICSALTFPDLSRERLATAILRLVSIASFVAVLFAHVTFPELARRCCYSPHLLVLVHSDGFDWRYELPLE